MAEQQGRQIQFDIVVDGAVEGASQVQGLNTAFEATARTAGVASRGIATTSTAVTQGGRKWGELAGAIGNVASVFGQLSPVASQAGSVVGAVGTASTALTGALGPLGVGIAAVTSALGLILPLLQDTSSNMRDLDRDTQGAAQSTADLIRELRTARREQSISEGRASTEALGESVEDLEERLNDRRAALSRYQEGIDQLRDLANAAEQRRRTSSDVGVTLAARREVLAVEESMRRLVETRDAAEEEITLLTERAGERRMEQMRSSLAERLAGEEEAEEAAADRRARRSSRGASNAAREAAALQARDQAMRQEALQVEIRFAQQQQAAEEAAQQARVNAMLENEEYAAQRRAEIRQRDQEAMQESLQAEIRAVQAAEAEKLRVFEEFRDESMPMLQGAVTGLTDALSSVIAGTKSADQAFQGMLSSFLEMIAQQAALEAAKEFASAIGSFASQDYAGGALHLAAGAAWTGVAVAAGAASIATAPAAESAPANLNGGSAGDGGGGGSSYTFNINGPVLSAGSRANLGRELSGLTDEGARRFGRAA